MTHTSLRERGAMLERATGQPLEEYARELRFEPLGIVDPAWPFTPLGVPMTGGGLGLRSRDLLAFAELYRNGGRIGDHQVVPADWVEASIRPHAQIDDVTEYGYLWWLKDYTAGERTFESFYMSGNGGNRVTVVPEQGMVVVLTTTNFGRRDAHPLADRLLTEHVLPAVRYARRCSPTGETGWPGTVALAETCHAPDTHACGTTSSAPRLDV